MIVGTYPSQTSRDLDKYYANPGNQLWKLMSHVLNVDLKKLDYNNRIETLLERKIGLWDTIKTCQITGSSDRSIHNEEYNDFSHLGHIKKIICNGKKVEKYIKHCNVPDNIEILTVPSSSPARAMNFSDKLDKWKVAIDTLHVVK